MKLYAKTGFEWANENCVGLYCPALTGATHLRLLDSNPTTENHGTLVNTDRNTAWVGSEFGSVINLDNTDDRIDFAVVNAINAAPDITFSVLYYPFSSVGLNTIFNNWNASQTTQGFYAFRNGLQIAFQMPGSSNRVTTSAILQPNRWNHLVLRKRSAINGLQVFCNGFTDGITATPGNLNTQPSTAPLNLAGNYGGTGAGNCLIAEFGIWTFAWTNQQIFEYSRAAIFERWQLEPPRRRSYFAQVLTMTNRNRSSRYLCFPG